ncbi:MAG: magnesium/cobalt transporter CorA [Cyanobacteria bacterium]|nr:magnesium/cobalt transporter CorA [Cyanobacteriota bacterium]MDA1021038.1 magnesium/cobalt transporter CorA [Cyanobacteriota bacterium]
MGLAPGTIVISEHDKELDFSSLSVSKINYNESFFDKEVINKIPELEQSFTNFKDDQITWINIDSSKANIVKKVGEILKIHPLVQEDIVNTHQVPKIENWDDYLYVVIRMFYYDKEKKETNHEQISFILGDNYLISFQEKPGDVFNNVRSRIENTKGRIRTMHADYLLYSLLDSIVDQYFTVIDKFSELAETIEDQLENKLNNANLKRIQKLKREILFNRRYIVPTRELISSLIKTESTLISKDLLPFLNDLYDHAFQVNQSFEMLREFIVSIIEIAHSNLSNKMNEIMKVLTMVSTVFIPITFIVGVYGMNFVNMPELSIPWAYPAVIALMLLIVVAMFIYFKKKHMPSNERSCG